jgi:hypothetical protein
MERMLEFWLYYEWRKNQNKPGQPRIVYADQTGWA